jgi:hypothetical protein
VRFTSYGNKTQQNSLPTCLGPWQKGVLETVWPQFITTQPFVYIQPIGANDVKGPESTGIG